MKEINTKFDKIIAKMVIGSILTAFIAVLCLAQCVISSCFNITINGMAYYDYATWYFANHPYVLVLEILASILVIIFDTNVIYSIFYPESYKIKEE